MDTRASPLDFLGKPEYNQFITCPRTRTRVSFAEIGATNRPTLLFIVPSFCSRFIGAPQLTPLAEHYGVRVISVDRPGCGGTTQCPLNKRLDIASDNVRSVLEYLGVDPKDTFIATHSAGAMFTLHLLGKHPDLFPKNPHVFMTSAWVPVSVSGQMGLNLVPSMLISNFHKFLPTFVPIFNGVGSSLAFSKGLLTGRSMDESAFTPPDVMRPISSAPTTFHRNHIFQIPKAWNDAILHCITNLESTQGVSQDYLLCLGRNEGGIDSKWYEQMVTNISHAYKERGARVHFELWWAANDKIIPVKGQKWFTELLKKQGDAFEVTSFDLVGVGHDDPLMFSEVFCPIFEEVRASCSQ